jgi:hypothetical protein
VKVVGVVGWWLDARTSSCSYVHALHNVMSSHECACCVSCGILAGRENLGSWGFRDVVALVQNRKGEDEIIPVPRDDVRYIKMMRVLVCNSMHSHDHVQARESRTRA